jgi:hypothetical protein
MFEIQLLLPELLAYAGNIAPITAETNEERLEQLLSWMESLDECAYPAGEEPHVAFQDAQRLTLAIRAIQAQTE